MKELGFKPRVCLSSEPKHFPFHSATALQPSVFSATKTIPTIFIFPNDTCSLLETALQSCEIAEIIL